MTPPVPAHQISPAITLHTLLFEWQTGWLLMLALAIELALAAWYVVSVRRLARRGRRWSRWRTASFLGGTVLVVVAVQSGLASYDDEVFSAHVVQHLILMNFAPIFYALGAPVTLALQASSRRTQERLLRILHFPPVEWITSPAFAVTMAYITMIAFFLSAFYDFTVRHPLLLDLTNLHFLISGCLFWWLIVGLDPSRWRLGYGAKLGFLALSIPVTAVLGVALTGAQVSIAPGFHSVGDTHQGGSILWIVGELTNLVAMGIIVYQWMRYEERLAVRADRQFDAARAAELAELARVAPVAGGARTVAPPGRGEFEAGTGRAQAGDPVTP